MPILSHPFRITPIILAVVSCQAKPPSQQPNEPEDTQSITTHVAPGTDTFLVPSSTNGLAIATRIHWPASDRSRYSETAPIVIQVAGGWHAGELSEQESWTLAELHGYVHISFLLPSGVASDGSISSTGQLDTRGSDSVAALTAVIDYATGQIADTENLTITDRIPFADTSHIGLYGESNGGNLTISALSLSENSQGAVRWASFWESPVGDQFATTEINDNSFYQVNSCDIVSCPMPGIEDQLRFDADGKTQVILNGSPTHLEGVFFLDADGDSHPDPDERRFSGIPHEDESELKVYPSVELRQLLLQHQTGIFTESPPPSWLPSLDEVIEFWRLRDGSQTLSEASAAHPELLIMVTQRRLDHVLTAEDNPHALNHIRQWQQAGIPFFRLNPDATYMSAVTGIEEAFLPDNPANVSPQFPASTSWMVPNDIDGVSMTTALKVASILELADRAQFNNLDANLFQVISPL